jgi:O-antigen ligase
MLYGGCFSVLALERYNSFSDIARILTRSFIWVVLFALMGNLFVHGEALHMIVNRWVPDRPRLQFLNAHPLASGDIVALGMICILFKDRLRALDYLALAAFGYLLFLTDSTAARLTLPLIGVAWWLTGTNYRAALMKTGLFLVAAAVLALLFIQFAPSVLNSPAAERYVTLTGRAKFWEALYWSPLVGSFLGTGFDASSVAILELLRKNYHAHNEYLSTLVELGYIGVALHTLLLLTWIFVLLRAKKALPFAILIYMLMVGITNPMLFTKPVPIFFFMLSFLGALHILRPSPVTYEAQPAEVEAGRVQAVSR